MLLLKLKFSLVSQYVLGSGGESPGIFRRGLERSGNFLQQAPPPFLLRPGRFFRQEFPPFLSGEFLPDKRNKPLNLRFFG
jgi:hypothetical protein